MSDKNGWGARVVVNDINSGSVDALMNVKFLAHLEFRSEEDFEKAISLGFDPYRWKTKNRQKIYYRTLKEV